MGQGCGGRQRTFERVLCGSWVGRQGGGVLLPGQADPSPGVLLRCLCGCDRVVSPGSGSSLWDRRCRFRGNAHPLGRWAGTRLFLQRASPAMASLMSPDPCPHTAVRGFPEVI